MKCPKCQSTQPVRTATVELNQITNAKFVGVSRLEIGDLRFTAQMNLGD